MNNEQVQSDRIPQPTRDELVATYRECRMAGDVAGAEAIALRAFRCDMLRPVNLSTREKRSYPMTEMEFARWNVRQGPRWSRWLECPGAVRPPRFDDDGRHQAGF